MKSTAFSMISEPRMLKNLGKPGSGFLLESSGLLSGLSFSFGLSSVNKQTKKKKTEKNVRCDS